jgi:hypothetical protein
MTQLLIGGVEDVRARWSAWEACFTPEAVVDQGLRWAEWHSLIRISTVLDPCAGAGVFGKVARRLWPEAELLAFEPRCEESEHLQRHYDAVGLMTAQQGAVTQRDERFDLVTTNPPWGEGEETQNWGDIFDAVWPLVAERGLLMLLGPSTWGHSDETSECARVFDEHVPAYQLRIRGRIAFNGGSSTDNRKCSWWVWCNDGVARDSTTMITLPALPAEARRWNVRPGTEE